MGAVGQGGVFRGHAEGVPAHGVQDVEALHALVAGHHVADGVVAHVPHVNPPRGIGEHFQDIIFGLLRVLGYPKKILLLPDPLPSGFDGPGIVAVFHAADRSCWMN